MNGKQFFEGERVILVEALDGESLPESVPKTMIGKVTQANDSSFQGNRVGDYLVLTDQGESFIFYGRELGAWRVSRTGSSEIYGRFTVERANSDELKKGFETRLSEELGLVRQLAASQDETHRAGVLATLRNITRYLSSEVDGAYREAERLAAESDETGRAAALATLRNLNRYLTERNQSRPHSG